MDWLAALRGLSGLAELGGFLPGAGQRLASVAFLVIEPADSGLFDKADLANVGRNYLAMAATMRLRVIKMNTRGPWVQSASETSTNSPLGWPSWTPFRSATRT